MKPSREVEAELVMVYRKTEGERLVLKACGCGTLTPRRGGVCGKCLEAGDVSGT